MQLLVSVTMSFVVVVEVDPPYSPHMMRKGGVAFKPWTSDTYDMLASVLATGLPTHSYTLAVYTDVPSINIVQRAMSENYDRSQVRFRFDSSFLF